MGRGGANDSGGVGKELVGLLSLCGICSCLGIVEGGGGVFPRRSWAEASLESGARWDNLRPLESVDGLIKIELERKVGWCWKGGDSLVSKPYWAASALLAASKRYPNGEVLNRDVADCGCGWTVGVLLEVFESGEIGSFSDTGVPS